MMQLCLARQRQSRHGELAQFLCLSPRGEIMDAEVRAVLQELIRTELFWGDHPQRQEAFKNARDLIARPALEYTAADLAAIQRARDEYCADSDDDIAIDDTPSLSHGDGGLWVAAWVWILDSPPIDGSIQTLGNAPAAAAADAFNRAEGAKT